MMTTRRTAAMLGVMLVLAALGGCTSTGPSGANSSNGNSNANDNSNLNDNTNVNGNSADQPSPGFAAFTAGGCAACHPSQATDFSDSTTDDIVATLLDEVPHPSGAFGDLTDEDVDNITDFLLAVMLGAETLDGGTTANDNENDNANDNTNDNGSTSTAHADFVRVWTNFDENYSHFAAKGVDWDAIRSTHEPRFSGELSTAEFLDTLAEMLAELRDLHVWLFDAAGEVVEVYSQPATPNYPNFYPDGVTQWGEYPLWHGRLDGNVAFIGIETFEGSKWEGLRTGEVDDLFATYADADALILDVRFNNGGDENVARVFASHLTETSYVYGYHRTKNRSTVHNDFGPLEEHRLDPADSQRFLKPAACLIGQRNLSSAEWFVLMMRENPNGITLVGDTTRGSSGFPQEYSLTSGIKYYIPSWEAFRADGTTPIEDEGIAPSPGFALTPEESYTADRDFVLESALTAVGK